MRVSAVKIALQAPLFAMPDGLLMYVYPYNEQKGAIVPSHLQHRMIEENHRGHVGAYFQDRAILFSF